MESNRKRLNVHLYVTPVCNLNCKHCYYEAWTINDNPTHLLSIAELSHIITSLSKKFSASFDVEGGEFFLRKDIYKLFKSVDDQYWRNITITTNGSIAIREDSVCLQNLDEFRISIEGHTDELQQDLRGIKIAPIIRTCLQVKKFGVMPTLRITLTKKNYDQINEMLDYFLALGLRKFSFYEYQPVGRGKDYEQMYGLSSQEMEQALISLNPRFLSMGIDILKLSLSKKHLPLVDKYQSMLQQKGFEILDISGVPSLTIDFDGTLGICPWNLKGEKVGIYQEATFVADVINLIDRGKLYHVCDHCSSIRILFKSSI